MSINATEMTAFITETVNTVSNFQVSSVLLMTDISSKQSMLGRIYCPVTPTDCNNEILKVKTVCS